jgi:hypothetical protein
MHATMDVPVINEPSSEERRVNRRGRSYPASYRMDLVDKMDLSEDESEHSILADIRESAQRHKFQSIFDGAVATARSQEADHRADLESWIDSGGLADFLSLCIDAKPEEVGSVVCAAAEPVYQTEWATIIEDDMFRTPMSRFSDETIDSFSISGIYDTMKRLAPLLLSLIFLLSTRLPGQQRPSRTKKTLTPADLEALKQKEERRRVRHVVVALCVLGNCVNPRFNILQAIMSFYLYSSRVPKRVMSVMNHLGMSMAYPTLQQGLAAMAKSAIEKLGKLGSEESVFYISFDNLTKAAKVRWERLVNQGAFVTATAGYVLKLPASWAHRMFTRDDINMHQWVPKLVPTDFTPDDDDRDMMEKMFKHLIWNVLKTFAKETGAKVRNLDSKFPMPCIHQIPTTELPEILPVPTMNLNEGRTDDLIKILEAVRSVVGLTVEQIKNNIIPHRGDLMTTQGNRYHLRLGADVLGEPLFGDRNPLDLRTDSLTSMLLPVSSTCTSKRSFCFIGRISAKSRTCVHWTGG